MDIKGLDLDGARAIYLRDYWKPAGCDVVPPARNFDLFDAAVNSGVKAAVKLLQRAANMPDGDVDGVLGPHTLLCVKGIEPAQLVARFNGHRLELMTSLPTWPAFGKGWARRIAANLRAV